MSVYTPKIQEALEFAARIHQNQKRKIGGLPYLIHPVGVALILTGINAEEDLIIAALLHDTIEDGEGINKEVLAKKFGDRVAEIVYGVSEKSKSLSWQERKVEALDHVVRAGYDAILVKSADVVYNMNDVATSYQNEGEAIFEHFKASKEQQLERYQKLVKAVKDKWPQNPLMQELEEKLSRLENLWQ